MPEISVGPTDGRYNSHVASDSDIKRSPKDLSYLREASASPKCLLTRLHFCFLWLIDSGERGWVIHIFPEDTNPSHIHLPSVAWDCLSERKSLISRASCIERQDLLLILRGQETEQAQILEYVSWSCRASSQFTPAACRHRAHSPMNSFHFPGNGSWSWIKALMLCYQTPSVASLRGKNGCWMTEMKGVKKLAVEFWYISCGFRFRCFCVKQTKNVKTPALPGCQINSGWRTLREAFSVVSVFSHLSSGT